MNRCDWTGWQGSDDKVPVLETKCVAKLSFINHKQLPGVHT
jgi:hypothetical protein